MSLRKAVLLTNPQARGAGSRSGRLIDAFCSVLKDQNVEVTVETAAVPSDAAQIAASAFQSGATDIIIHGGDGTINSIIQGLVGMPVRVGIWPAGTANVLARELHIPADPFKAAELIAMAQTKLIYMAKATALDTGTIRHFVLMAGIGIDAAIVAGVNPRLKRIFGKAAFWYSGMRSLVRWRPNRFEVEIGGQKHPATFAAIGRSSRYGGNLAITPRASLDESQFEVCLMNTTSRMRYLNFLFHALGTGLEGDSDDVRFFRTQRVTVHGNSSVQVDGEIIGSAPMAFEISDWRLEVIVPEQIVVTPHLVPLSQLSRKPALSGPLPGSSL